MTREQMGEAERGRLRRDLWVWGMGVLFGVNLAMLVAVVLRH